MPRLSNQHESKDNDQAKNAKSALLESYGVGLYYPYINIRDPDWLKAALLYWDHIASIVPDNYVPNWRRQLPRRKAGTRRGVERETVKKAREVAVAKNLIDPVPPNEYREGAADRFLNQMLPLLETAAPLDFSIWREADQELFGSEGDWGLIHLDKMDRGLYELLQGAGLAQLIDGEVVTSRHIADAYMIALAAEISQEARIPALTDQPALAACGEYMKFGRKFRVVEGGTRAQRGDLGTPPAAPSILLRLNLPFPGPDDLREIPMRAVVDFHNDAQATKQRKEFRKALETVLKEAAALDDKFAQEKTLREKEEYISAVLEGQKEALDELGVSTIKSVMSIAVPAALTMGYTALTALGIVIGQPYLAIFGGTGAATGAVACYAEWRGKRRDLTSKTPWHYALTVDNRFPASSKSRKRKGGTSL